MQKLALLVATTLLALIAGWHPPILARADTPDWKLTGLVGSVSRLFPTTNGILYAQIGDDLFRTDDAGANWTPLPLPAYQRSPSIPERRIIAFNRQMSSQVYVSGEDGLYRSDDSGHTWQLVLDSASRTWQPPGLAVARADVIGVAASPADPQLLYVGLRNRAELFQFLRSRDGGSSWELLDEQQQSLCRWTFWLLEPHPQDPHRLLRTVACTAGRQFNRPLEESRDQGTTWATRFGAAYSGDDGERYLTPVRVVGGQGAQPDRFYMAAERDFRFGGSALLRSDDDTRTWSELLVYRGGGADPQRNVGQAGVPNMHVTNLTYNLAHPDVVYASFATARTMTESQEIGLGVEVSKDAGATWERLGEQSIGAVRDLYLTPDGLQLYAATSQGVYRIAVTP